MEKRIATRTKEHQIWSSFITIQIEYITTKKKKSNEQDKVPTSF